MTPDETVAVIRQTRTDQDRRISFDPEDRPGVSALLSTAALCRGVEPAAVSYTHLDVYKRQVPQREGAKTCGAIRHPLRRGVVAAHLPLQTGS